MDWSLEKIYKEQVSGNVPQRRHLRVLGEENTEQEKKFIVYTRDKIKELIDNLDIDDADPKQLKALYKRIHNFTAYRPLKKTVTEKGYHPDIIKKYSREIQNLIEDLDPEDSKIFIDYIKNPNKQHEFPRNVKGNLYTILKNTGIPDSVVRKIVTHTTQDEKKLGVGMGEVGLALIFKDIENTKEGKGDLSIRVGNTFEPFEIKGEGATLGVKPDDLIPSKNMYLGFPGQPGSYFTDFGLTHSENGKGYKVNNELVGVGKNQDFAEALSETYKQTDDKQGFKEELKRLLIDLPKLDPSAIDYMMQKIDFNNSQSIQSNIALINFITYAKKHGFTNFLAHDFGTEKYTKTGKRASSSAPMSGDYLYVRGTPEQMADSLLQNKVKFEKIKHNNLNPRVGFHHLYSDEEF
jgi:hypothetical protein